jgi:hypothetical protein
MASGLEAAATTIRSWTDRIRAAALSLMLVFLAGTTLLVAGLDSLGWAKHALVPAVAAYLAVAGLVVTWRICLSGVRFDDQGITVRNFFRTYRLSWPEVSEFTDGAASLGEETLWALKIMLRDGRTVTAAGTMRMERKRKGDFRRQSAVMTAIEQVAARYQIPVRLTGVPNRAKSQRRSRPGLPDR